MLLNYFSRKQGVIFFVVAIGVYLCGCGDSNQKIYVNCPGPFNLEEFHVWRDGGSLSFIFLCADNSRLSFHLDGGVKSPTNGYFYIEDDETFQGNRILLPLGGVEENRLLSVMNSWLESKFSNERLKEIINSTDFRNMTQDEFRAWHIKHVVESRPRVVKELLKKESSN
jgi:hypothetical protein